MLAAIDLENLDELSKIFEKLDVDTPYKELSMKWNGYHYVLLDQQYTFLSLDNVIFRNNLAGLSLSLSDDILKLDGVDKEEREKINSFKEIPLTPLQAASVLGRESVVKYLLNSCGADSKIINMITKESAREMAGHAEHHSIVKYFKHFDGDNLIKKQKKLQQNKEKKEKKRERSKENKQKKELEKQLKQHKIELKKLGKSKKNTNIDNSSPLSTEDEDNIED